jgi:anti-sigma factor RsiW
MHHEITPEFWEDYLEGILNSAERSRIETHLQACAACRALAAQLTHCTARLHEAKHYFDATLLVSAEKLDAAWQSLRTQLQAEAAPLQQRLDELEAALAALCGSHTAARALHTAAEKSPARSLAQLTREDWEPFLHALLAIARALCGRTGARLILESGQL